MRLSINSLPRRHWIPILSLAFALTGCGQSSDCLEPVVSVPVRIDVMQSAFMTPLTEQDVAIFLQVLEHLPNRQIPEILPAELPTLRPGHDIEGQVQVLRNAMRSALSPEVQADHWMADPQVRTHLRKIGINPVAFAELTLRISSAWSALVVAPETRSPELRAQIHEQVVALVHQLKQKSESAFEMDQKRLILEELVAFSEFLSLIDLVPETSIQTVSRCRRQLAHVLPERGWLAETGADDSVHEVHQVSGQQPDSQ